MWEGWVNLSILGRPSYASRWYDASDCSRTFSLRERDSYFDQDHLTSQKACFIVSIRVTFHQKKNDCLVLAYGILQVCIPLNFSLTLWWFQKFHEAICKNLKKSQEISSSRHSEHFIPGKSVCKTLFQVLICRQCDAWRTGKSTFHVWILKQAWIDSSWQGVWVEGHRLVKLRDAVNKCDVCFNHIWMGWKMASRPLALSPRT